MPHMPPKIARNEEAAASEAERVAGLRTKAATRAGIRRRQKEDAEHAATTAVEGKPSTVDAS